MITQVGVMAHACAIGQAAAAIFADGAIGRDRASIRLSERHLAAWLAGGQSMPDWPSIGLLEPARERSARHGAILLPWKAALAALPLPGPPR